MGQPPRLYLSPPHMSPDEESLLVAAFRSNWIAPLGPEVDAFEREFAHAIGIGSAAALSSGTAALHLAMVMLGVGHGDEVYCSTFTFAATANAVKYLGAEPVFIDSEPATWNMDPGLLAEELTRAAQHNRLPKAVIVVDLYGQCADYDAILECCARYDVPVIEDAAEALGATYRGKPAGQYGVMACFSFNGNKIITTSGGGMLVSADRMWCDRARNLASQARDPAPHYEHSSVGYNYRLSNLLAAIGRGQLRVLPDRVAKRRRHFDCYYHSLSGLPGIGFMPESSKGMSTRWLTCITVDSDRFGASRETIRLALEAENIESRPLWKPMHMQPVYRPCRIVGGEVSATLFRDGLCLPSGSGMSDPDRERVVDVVRRLLA